MYRKLGLINFHKDFGTVTGDRENKMAIAQ